MSKLLQNLENQSRVSKSPYERQRRLNAKKNSSETKLLLQQQQQQAENENDPESQDVNVKTKPWKKRMWKYLRQMWTGVLTTSGNNFHTIGQKTQKSD